jgi:hypothetical protein
MTIAYEWKFESLDVFINYQTVTNAVESMHWQLSADDGLGHHASAVGETKTGPVDLENFIPFEDLTEEIVQGWCEAAMGTVDVDGVKAMLAGQIDQAAAPTMASLTPPWL